MSREGRNDKLDDSVTVYQSKCPKDLKTDEEKALKLLYLDFLSLHLPDRIRLDMVERHTTSKRGKLGISGNTPGSLEDGHSRFGHIDSLLQAFLHY
jgi:hypothetical protein